ncbi:S-layer homology domain-containing protein [Paenibacillus sp. KN14-4R]|uniref:S-layer homology domain-containing protein n=1 Tax=Paenibacillus sp. KN14-4R TaxID=3445773 RepID=UPI003FA06DCE
MNKVLGIILSVVLALTALPANMTLAATNLSSSDFTDLKGLSAADKAIFDELIKDGIFVGKGNRLFGLRDNMKRSEFAVAITKAKGLKISNKVKKSSFADMKSDRPEVPYMEAAYEDGIVNGVWLNPPLFAPDEDVKREDLAIFLVGALGDSYKEEARLAKGSDPTVSDYAQGYVATALKYKLIEKQANGQFGGLQMASRYELAHCIAAVRRVMVINPNLEIASVKSGNLQEINVRFTQAVDANTAENVSNYQLKSGKRINYVTLSESGRTATITLKDWLDEGKPDNITIRNIRAGSLRLDEHSEDFKTVINTYPLVSEMTPLGDKAIKLEFSEPIRKLEALPFGGEYSAFLINRERFRGTIELAPNGRYAILTPYGGLKAGQTEFINEGQIRGLSGRNGSFGGGQPHYQIFNFAPRADHQAPTVQSINQAVNHVTVTFSEDINSKFVSNDSAYWVVNGQRVAAPSVIPLAGNQYRFLFDEKIASGSQVFVVEGMEDYLGNKMVQHKVNLPVEMDQIAPEVRGMQAVSFKRILVEFSKAVTEETTLNTSNYVVTDQAGNKYPISSLAFLDPQHRKTVMLEFDNDLPVGKIKLGITQITDDTNSHNKLKDYTGEVNIYDYGKWPVEFQCMIDIMGSTRIAIPLAGENDVKEQYSTQFVDSSGILNASIKPVFMIKGKLPLGVKFDPVRGDLTVTKDARQGTVTLMAVYDRIVGQIKIHLD